MKKILSIFLCLVFGYAGFAQVDTLKQRQLINAYGYNWKNTSSDSSARIPRDTFKLAVKDSGSIAWVGRHLWGWTGHKWQKIDSATASSAGSGSGFSLRTVTSANFTTTTGCPIPPLDGDTLQIFWNDVGRFLVGGTEWTYKAGGGFTILLSGFDATAANYSFSVYANDGSTTPGPLTITSSNFSTATNCPLPTLNGMSLSIFWNDANRYLLSSEWTALAGGGFIVTVPGFDASTTNYTFFVFNQ